MAISYSEQLRHPNWQRKRLERLQKSDFTCEDCGTKEKTLHVHHKRYVKGRLAWEYENEELAVLCEDCHQFDHQIREAIDEVLIELPPGHVLPLLAGMLNMGRIGKDGRARSPADGMFPHSQSAREYLIGHVVALLTVPCEQSNVILAFAASLLQQQKTEEFRVLGQRLGEMAEIPAELQQVIDDDTEKQRS